jgi:hypothetical protein
MGVTVGIYYALPSGTIAYTYGFNDAAKTISYRLDDDHGARTATYAELEAWTPRSDLKDFPNASDPRLPYVFDLRWDLKYLSDLRNAIESRHADLTQMLELAASNGIVVDGLPLDASRGTGASAEAAPFLGAVQSLPGVADMQSIALLKELLKQFYINDDGHLQWSYMTGTSVASVVGEDMEKQLIAIRGPEDYLS